MTIDAMMIAMAMHTKTIASPSCSASPSLSVDDVRPKIGMVTVSTDATVTDAKPTRCTACGNNEGVAAA